MDSFVSQLFFEREGVSRKRSIQKCLGKRIPSLGKTYFLENIKIGHSPDILRKEGEGIF